MNPRKSIAVIDIGNSNIKAFVDSEKITCDYSAGWTDKISLFLENYLPSNGILGISSVQPERFEQLIEKIRYKVITADELLKNQNIIDFNEIEGIGNDRLLGLIGATINFFPPLITVDCGTAITINVLNERYKCDGGVIFPGIETQLEALTTKAAQLNTVDLYLEDNIIGKNTDSAIRIGIINGVTGAILYFIENIINLYGFENNINLILTGGTSKLIQPLLEKSNLKFHFDENLVLNGLFHLINHSFGTDFAK
jgi:type III pantothenate kinase